MKTIKKAALRTSFVDLKISFISPFLSNLFPISGPIPDLFQTSDIRPEWANDLGEGQNLRIREGHGQI
jgi:hypothetical protein